MEYSASIWKIWNLRLTTSIFSRFLLNGAQGMENEKIIIR